MSQQGDATREARLQVAAPLQSHSTHSERVWRKSVLARVRA
jgi:hypothetical protein